MALFCNRLMTSWLVSAFTLNRFKGIYIHLQPIYFDRLHLRSSCCSMEVFYGAMVLKSLQMIAFIGILRAVFLELLLFAGKGQSVESGTK